jgi:hypothetical protein
MRNGRTSEAWLFMLGFYHLDMAYDEALAARVRDSLRDIETTEKKMFGGLAFMTSGHMTVGVYGDGLIARIGAENMDTAVAEPGVRPFDMTGRPMRGIVIVPAETLDDTALDRWIARARRHVASLPPK